MRQRIAGIIFFVLLSGLFGVNLAQAQPLQQDNLLVNPSFEQPFEEYFRADGGGFVAHGWSPWWNNDAGHDLDGPEFKQANINVVKEMVGMIIALRHFESGAKAIQSQDESLNALFNQVGRTRL